MKRSFLSLILILLSGLRTTVVAQKYFTDSGETIFYSKVPLHNFSGTSNNLTGLINLEDNTVDFYVDLKSLDTGNGKRDKDMRKTLKVDKFQYGEFFGKLVSPFDTTSTDVQPAKVAGIFKIHGKEKEIEVEGTLQKTPEGIQLIAGWMLNLSDYEIKPPKLLMIKVQDVQEITIDALLTPYTEDQ
ncbi:MAG: YceI family protein [Bacteroidota bacterium]